MRWQAAPPTVLKCSNMMPCGHPRQAAASAVQTGHVLGNGMGLHAPAEEALAEHSLQSGLCSLCELLVLRAAALAVALAQGRCKVDVEVAGRPQQAWADEAHHGCTAYDSIRHNHGSAIA